MQDSNSEKHGDYRIVSNGTTFKVEKIVKCSFLWWKWTRYDPLCSMSPSGDFDTEIEFNTIEGAKNAIKKLKEEDKIWRSPWKEVTSPATHGIVTTCDVESLTEEEKKQRVLKVGVLI